MGDLTPIKQRLNATAPSTRSSSPMPARLPETWIKALFGRFALIWPRDWASIVERIDDLDALRQEWAEGLAGMSGDQIKTAIVHCRAHLFWSPGIAEFRQAGIADTPEQRAFKARLARQRTELDALPARTWAERKADGERHARAILASIAEHTENTGGETPREATPEGAQGNDRGQTP